MQNSELDFRLKKEIKHGEITKWQQNRSLGENEEENRNSSSRGEDGDREGEWRKKESE